jgi:hypothetical protein
MISSMKTADPRELLGDTFRYGEARAAGLSDARLYGLRDTGAILAVGGGVYRWADAPPADIHLIDIVRTRHIQGSDIAWEALRRWTGQPGRNPAQLIELAKHFTGAEPALRKSLEILL